MLEFMLRNLPKALVLSFAVLAIGLGGMLVLAGREVYLQVRRRYVGPARQLIVFPAIILVLWASLFFVGLRQLDLDEIHRVEDRIVMVPTPEPIDLRDHCARLWRAACPTVASLLWIPKQYLCKSYASQFRDLLRR